MKLRIVLTTASLTLLIFAPPQTAWAQSTTVNAAPNMYKTSLLFLLLFNCYFLRAQEIQNRFYRTSKRESCPIIKPAFNHDPNYPTARVIYRTATRSRPSSFIYSKPILYCEVCSNKSLRCYRHRGFQGESCKRHCTPVWMVGKEAETHRLNVFVNLAVTERVIFKLTKGNVCCFIVTAFRKTKPSRRNLCPCIPRSQRNINRPEGFISASWLEAQYHMCSRKEISLAINQESSAHNFSDLSGPAILLVRHHAQDRDYRPLNGLYCFDGHIFRFTPKGKCENQKQDYKPASGIVIPPSSSIGLQYVSH